MAKLWLSYSAQSMLAHCRWLMFLIGEMISSMVIVLALKSSMIPNFCAKNEVILGTIILTVLDHIRLGKDSFAISVFEEIQLYSSFTLSLEHPV
jgi:hypothetical protein